MSFDFSSFKVIEYQPNQFAHEASAIIHLDKIVFNATSLMSWAVPDIFAIGSIKMVNDLRCKR